VEIIVNFDDERFVKIFTRDTVTWKLLGWEGRCVLLMLLRKVDRAGCVDLGSGIEGLALLLDLPEDVTERGFAACLRRSCVTQHDQIAVVPNFVRAQDSRQTDRVRQAESRARRRDSGLVSQNVTDTNEQVTKRDEASQPVTRSHTESHDVTPRLDQTRTDQNKYSLVDSDQSQPELALVPQQAAESGHKSQSDKPGAEQSQAKPKRASTHTAIATTLLGELSAARMRINPKNRVFPPSPAHLREIERCLRDGLTVDQLRNVILVWEEMVKAGKQHPDHFDSLTPFRASNVAKYTEKSLEEARKPWSQAPQATRPPEPPKSPRAGESDFQRQIRESRERGEIT
jgi:hypothetical protein